MLTSTHEVVADIAVLSPTQAAEITSTLMSLREHWVTRNLYAPFFTLGAASYLDATGRAPRYGEWAASFNPILRTHFAELYSRLLSAVESWTGEPVEYASHLALPGFHIYLSSPLFEKPVASIHCDSQFNLHPWPAGADLGNPISFTLSVALPATGGGLYTWEVEAPELQGKSDAEVGALMGTRPRQFHPYQVGHLALHSGNVLHQAAPGRDLAQNDMRITLQGHGIRVNGVWQIYW